MQQRTTTEPCRCWSCRAELGTTDGEQLYLSDRARIKRATVVWCSCGNATYWRPSKAVRRAVACDTIGV